MINASAFGKFVDLLANNENGKRVLWSNLNDVSVMWDVQTLIDRCNSAFDRRKSIIVKCLKGVCWLKQNKVYWWTLTVESMQQYLKNSNPGSLLSVCVFLAIYRLWTKRVDFNDIPCSNCVTAYITRLFFTVNISSFRRLQCHWLHSYFDWTNIFNLRWLLSLKLN